jgi:hypothetical protein
MIGLGMIAGPKIAYDMLVSTLFGWGFLSWLSRKRGWVSGPTGDWKRGFRSWIIWPGLAALLTDCLVNVLGSVYAASTYSRDLHNRKVDQRRDGATDDSEESQEAILETRSYFREQPMEFVRAIISSKAIGLGLVAIILLCPFVVNFTYGNMLAWVEIFGAFVLALPLSYMAIQATGRTDTTPASALGKLSTAPLPPGGRIEYSCSTSKGLSICLCILFRLEPLHARFPCQSCCRSNRRGRRCSGGRPLAVSKAWSALERVRVCLVWRPDPWFLCRRPVRSLLVLGVYVQGLLSKECRRELGVTRRAHLV